MSKKNESAGLTLLRLVWAESNRHRSFSWEVLNHSMRSALSLAISSGMDIAAGDWPIIHNDFNAGRWIGDGGWEWCYASAIACGNTAVIESFEAWERRPPFIADDVSCAERFERHAGSLFRKRGRLAVGFSFPWQGQTVTVTSIERDHVVACTYEPEPERPVCDKCGQRDWSQRTEYRRRTPARRFKITREDIIADRAARKAAKK